MAVKITKDDYAKAAIVSMTIVLILAMLAIPFIKPGFGSKIDCKYYAQDVCIKHCSCNWCVDANVCTSNAERCGSNVILSNTECPINMQAVYILIALSSIPLAVFIVCLILTTKN